VAALVNYWITILGIYVTLYLNIYFHHDEEVDPLPMANGKYRCRAHDKMPWVGRLAFDIVGEMNHYDHHRYPRCGCMTPLTHLKRCE
jgi:hypothetical protein